MSDKKENLANISFKCSPDLAKRLEDAKWTHRKSKSQIIIEALEKYLADLKPSPQKGKKS